MKADSGTQPHDDVPHPRASGLADPAGAAAPPAPGRGHAQRPARLPAASARARSSSRVTMPCPAAGSSNTSSPASHRRFRLSAPRSPAAIPSISRAMRQSDSIPGWPPVRASHGLRSRTRIIAEILALPLAAPSPKRCTVIRPEHPHDGNPSGAPHAIGQLVRRPLVEHPGPCRRSEVGINEVALQRAVGRHRAGQRQSPFPLEPPQRVPHPHQQRAHLPWRQLRALAQGAPVDALLSGPPHVERYSTAPPDPAQPGIRRPAPSVHSPAAGSSDPAAPCSPVTSIASSPLPDDVSSDPPASPTVAWPPAFPRCHSTRTTSSALPSISTRTRVTVTLSYHPYRPRGRIAEDGPFRVPSVGYPSRHAPASSTILASSKVSSAAMTGLGSTPTLMLPHLLRTRRVHTRRPSIGSQVGRRNKPHPRAAGSRTPGQPPERSTAFIPATQGVAAGVRRWYSLRRRPASQRGCPRQLTPTRRRRSGAPTHSVPVPADTPRRN